MSKIKKVKELTKKQKEIYSLILSKPGYLKKSLDNILMNTSLLDKYSSHDSRMAYNQAKVDVKIQKELKKSLEAPAEQALRSPNKIVLKSFKDIFPWIDDEHDGKLVKSKEFNPIIARREKFDKNNVIILGDTHFPFEKEGYLDFCVDIQKKYKAGTVLHIGDVADNCYSSFHDNNPDGLAAGEELSCAIKSAKEWQKAFPLVKVTLGNHCQIIQRKAFASGVSSKWIKGLSEVLELPGWQFEMEHEIDGVLYTHGTGTSGDKAAYNKALNKRKSVVQGHLHSQASIMWNTSSIDKVFAMQVGCGVDEKKYAFDYAKNFPKKFIVSCGVVLESGTLPILELMKL